MSTEIDDRQVDIAGDYLKNRKITIGVSGGIAAIEMPKLARHLRRYGAKVRAIMTSAAEKIINPVAMHWGTGSDVVTKLGGRAEHIELEDLIVVAPATLNTINKIANGIADNSLTTAVASAMGRTTPMGKKIPILIAPSMHESLYNNPILQDNIQKLEACGVQIIPPRGGEGKAKIAKNKYITAECIRALSYSDLKGKKVLVTAGPTPGKIDEVRMITNRFKGRTGIEIAKEAYLRGADVRLLLGSSGLKPPEMCIDTILIRSFDEYMLYVMDSLKENFDIGIFSAAVADYVPKEAAKGKIPSKGGLGSIALKETPKVIEDVRKACPDLYMVTFKYECGIDTTKLIEIAKSRTDKYQLVVANRGEDMQRGQHYAMIIGKEGVIAYPGSKQEIARNLMDAIEYDHSRA